MCKCKELCPKCDPGIEAYYQEQVKKAGAFSDLLDAEAIWYDYCALRREEEMRRELEDLEPEDI